MNNALISPQELVYSYDGTLLGQRIAETEPITFEVALPLYWVECADEVNADEWYYDENISQCELKPIPPDDLVDTSIPPENTLNASEIVS